jgi:hypothetical protein
MWNCIVITTAFAITPFVKALYATGSKALMSIAEKILSLAATARMTRRPPRQAAGEESADILERAGDSRAVPANNIGTVRVALNAAREIGLIEFLTVCGLGLRTAIIITAHAITRMAHPASEKESLRWLQGSSGLGRLMESTSRRPTR